MNTTLKKSLLFSFIFALITFFSQNTIQAIFESENAGIMIETGHENELNFIQKWMGRRWLKKQKKELKHPEKYISTIKNKLEKIHNKSQPGLIKEVDNQIENAFTNLKTTFVTLEAAHTSFENSTHLKNLIQKTDLDQTILQTMLTESLERINELKEQITQFERLVTQYKVPYKENLSILTVK